MLLSRNIKVAGFLLLLYGCEPAATFEKPQPVTSKNLPAFPRKIFGKYWAQNGRSYILIQKEYLIRTVDFEDRMHKNELDSTVNLTGNILTDLESEERFEVKLNGDSIIIHHFDQDTFFNISGGDILKKFKGRYFLNNKCGDNSWEVTSVAFRKEKLSLKTIASSKDVEKLRELTSTSNDSTTIFDLTKKQFKEFINADGFSNEELFYRRK